MERYVDIEGSGELNTKITYPGSVSILTGTVVGVNDAELRWLTVENTGGAYSIAIYKRFCLTAPDASQRQCPRWNE